MDKNPGEDLLHKSVLLEETITYIQPQDSGTYVDGTLGLGGHSQAILRRSSPGGRLVAFEWDEAAIAYSSRRLAEFEGRFHIVRRNFADLSAGLKEVGVSSIDGLLVDIGLSSLQLDQGGRGFSFRFDEPLDMRMDMRRRVTAQSILQTCSEKELADIFFYYGEERQARPIAANIIAARKIAAIKTTKQLAVVVAQAIPKRFHPKRIHVATKVFQALRIAVNTELENLARILDEGIPYLKAGARFCVISFHSLEDRMVKRKFRDHEDLDVLTPKPVMPTPEEIELNPRSRSARLRVAVKKG